MPRVLTIRIREVLISRDSGREGGREDPIRYISKKRNMSSFSRKLLF